MDVLLDLLSGYDPESPNFRPTEIYNEGWLLKAVVHQVEKVEDDDFPLAFAGGATWFSEGLLPTAFGARYRGDPHAESRTNADCVIGHVSVGKEGKADLALQPDATQFIVIEAKLGSRLSRGTSNAPYFDQAARSVACVAETMRRAECRPSDMERLGFVILAPEGAVEAGTVSEEMAPRSVRRKVQRRVASYQGRLDAWHQEWFEPMMNVVELHVLSWEEVLEWLEEDDEGAASSLGRYYELCLRFN